MTTSEILSRTITWLFEHLTNEGVNYCVLRNYDCIPDKVENDIDILVDERDNEISHSVVTECARHFGWVVYSKSSTYYILSHFSAREWHHLRLDFVNHLQANGLIYLSGEIVLDSRRRREDGLYIPSVTIEFVHVLVHALFGPKYNQGRYVSYLSKKVSEGDLDYSKAESLLGQVFPIPIAQNILESLSSGKIIPIFQDKKNIGMHIFGKKN